MGRGIKQAAPSHVVKLPRGMCNWAQTQRAKRTCCPGGRACIICTILEIFIIFSTCSFVPAPVSSLRVELLSDERVMSEICHKAITHTLHFSLQKSQDALLVCADVAAYSRNHAKCADLFRLSSWPKSVKKCLCAAEMHLNPSYV